jgi:hypothetical protein
LRQALGKYCVTFYGIVPTHGILSKKQGAVMERKLAAILAADVVGYSTLMEQDEQGTFERLRPGVSVLLIMLTLAVVMIVDRSI